MASHWITLTSNSPLLYMIQDLDGDFVNHFLNIFAEHEDETPVFRGMRETMMDEIRFVALYKALTGSGAGRTYANTFVVNDVRTGEVKVYDMADILWAAVERENMNKSTGIRALTELKTNLFTNK